MEFARKYICSHFFKIIRYKKIRYKYKNLDINMKNLDIVFEICRVL